MYFLKENGDLLSKVWKKDLKLKHNKLFKIKNDRLIIQLKCADCWLKKLLFVKKISKMISD